MTCATTIRIGQAIVDELVQHARREFPEECCGLLQGMSTQSSGHATQLGVPREDAPFEPLRMLIT